MLLDKHTIPLETCPQHHDATSRHMLCCGQDYRSRTMYRILTIIASVLLPGCSGDTRVVDRELFNSHARCAAFYVLLGNTTSSPEKKRHYASSLENHTKVGLNLIPDQHVFQSQFKLETQLLMKELGAQADDQSTANYMLSQTEKCAHAFFAYAKYIDAPPRPMN